ncbi:MAG: translocation/assembly module TamB [Tannerella sp.]|nr:translocation/assembly module TamB [Tannerella sp.]
MLLVFIALYIPPVQRVAVKIVTNYVAEKVDMKIRFDRLRLSFPLNLSACNVCVLDVADRDTVLYLNKLTVEVGLMPLLKGNIAVNGIRLKSLYLNTGNLINGVIVKGYAGDVFLKADSVNLPAEYALLNNVTLSDADIDLFVCDTTVADPSTSEVNWHLDLRKVTVRDVSFRCRMPCDSVYLDLKTDEAELSNGVVDLGKDVYGALELQLNMPKIFYGTDSNEPAPGFDLSHIFLSDVRLALDSLYYGTGNNIRAILREGSAAERSGMEIRSLTGRIESDSIHVNIPAFSLRTDHSTLQLQAIVPRTSIDRMKPDDIMSVNVSGFVGKQDVMLIAGDMPENFRKYYPNTSLQIKLSANGNPDNIRLDKLEASLPGAFRMNITGSVRSVTDEHLRTGTVHYNIRTEDMAFVAGMLSPQNRIRIPEDMSLTGRLDINKGLYATDLIFREGCGKIHLSGNYHLLRNSYEAHLEVDSLEPVHFMPDDSIMCLNAFVRAKGKGTDLYHASTWAELEGKVSNVCYGNAFVSDISLSGNLKNNHLLAEINSDCSLIKGHISIEGDIKKKEVGGIIIIDMDTLDLYGLKLTDTPLATSFQVYSEIASDLDKEHSLDITLGNCSLIFEKQTIQPKMLTLGFRSGEDTVRASFHAGDLDVMLTGNSDMNTLADKYSYLSGELKKQLEHDSTLHIQELRSEFPDLSIRINAGRDNPVYNFMQEFDVFFETLSLNATISPDEGLNVDGTVLSLVSDTFKIDTIRLDIWQDTLGLQYEANVAKNRFRNQEAFRTKAHGYIRKGMGDIFVSYINSRGEEGLHLGIKIEKATEGFDFHLYPEKPVIAYMPFTLNDNHYFRFKSLKEMEADLRLEGSSNASLWIHSDESSESMKEMMIELNQIDLADLSAGFAVLPPLKGLLNATLRYEPAENSFMIVADGNIDDLYYENGRIGELLLNATYMPVDDGTHQVDLHAFHDMSEIASLYVLYKEGPFENSLQGDISINKLPLNMFNAMIPDQIARLDGALLGKFSITGTDKNPLVDGALQIDKGSIYVVPAATSLRFDDKPVKVTKNRIRLDNYSIYALKNNPVVIDGTIDATNTSRPTVNLKVSATNLQLMDSKRTPGSLAYGRLFLNLNTTLNGPLQALHLRGNLHILGNTNLTYVMLDSPLEVQDSFSDLVTFSYFADTLPGRTRRPFNFVRGARNVAMASGIKVLLYINIDPVAKVRVDLDEEQSNFVELKGGGDLSLQYSAQGDMSLNGRYTLSDGMIRYTIPVIPLTDFTIRNGSYVDWNGDVMNPYLNITAYSRIRAAADIGGQKQMVDFNTGIQLKDKLEDVSLQFVLEAPANATVQNQLTSMGEEERGKQAVSLLVTGVYIAGQGTGTYNLDVGVALNSLLQREIKNILGNLFGDDVPLSFDVEMYDGTSGMGRRVDYLGRFYKGFLNERLNATLGLRVSTNNPKDSLTNLNGRNMLILDDVSLEYMLDTDGSRAVKVFMNKEYENLFENEIGKIGASFSLRRKVKRFRDLFILRKEDRIVPEEEAEEPEPTEEPELPNEDPEK